MISFSRLPCRISLVKNFACRHFWTCFPSKKQPTNTLVCQELTCYRIWCFLFFLSFAKSKRVCKEKIDGQTFGMEEESKSSIVARWTPRKENQPLLCGRPSISAKKQRKQHVFSSTICQHCFVSRNPCWQAPISSTNSYCCTSFCPCSIPNISVWRVFRKENFALAFRAVLRRARVDSRRGNVYRRLHVGLYIICRRRIMYLYALSKKNKRNGIERLCNTTFSCLLGSQQVFMWSSTSLVGQ